MPPKLRLGRAKSFKKKMLPIVGCDIKWLLAVPILGIWLRAGDALGGPPLTEKLEILRSIPHSGYSEGLHYHEGFLWHALPTEILKIDPKDGAVAARFKPATKYSESLVWVKGKLWNVSFEDNGIYRAELNGSTLKFEKKGSVPEVHAWGLEYDGEFLVVTGDYSNQLYFLNPGTLKVERKIVTDRKDLEDLAWDGVGFWSSSFTDYRGCVFRLNPKSGKSSKLFSLPHPEECPVIDGIAWDGKGLWITGKHCSSIYYAKRPTL